MLSLEILCYIYHLPWSVQVRPSSACHFHLAVHCVKCAHLALTVKWHYLASFIFGYTHAYHCQRDQFCHSINSQPWPTKEKYTKLFSDAGAFLTSVILIALVNKLCFGSLLVHSFRVVFLILSISLPISWNHFRPSSSVTQFWHFHFTCVGHHFFKLSNCHPSSVLALSPWVFDIVLNHVLGENAPHW